MCWWNVIFGGVIGPRGFTRNSLTSPHNRKLETSWETSSRRKLPCIVLFFFIPENVRASTNAEERNLEKSPGRFSRLGASSQVRAWMDFWLPFMPPLVIRIATRPPRPPFFDARQSRKNGQEGGEKTMISQWSARPFLFFGRFFPLTRIMISRRSRALWFFNRHDSPSRFSQLLDLLMLRFEREMVTRRWNESCSKVDAWNCFN